MSGLLLHCWVMMKSTIQDTLSQNILVSKTNLTLKLEKKIFKKPYKKAQFYPKKLHLIIQNEIQNYDFK